EARVDVAGAVDGEPFRIRAVFPSRPQVAQVAEDDLAVVVVGLAGQPDRGGFQPGRDQQGGDGRQAHAAEGPRARVFREHERNTSRNREAKTTVPNSPDDNGPGAEGQKETGKKKGAAPRGVARRGRSIPGVWRSRAITMARLFFSLRTGKLEL